MVRMLDLQDSLSKVQAVERIFENMRQQPDGNQKAFAQSVQQFVRQQQERVESTLQQEEAENIREREKERERGELKERERRKKEAEEEKERRKTGSHLIDITV